VNALLRPIDKLLVAFLTLLMIAIVVDVSWQVITRFLLDTPSSYTEEVARFLLIWIGLLGASYAYRTRAHLGLDIITSQLTGSSKRNTELTAIIISALFAASVMIYGGAKLVMLTFELNQVSASLGIPMSYIYLVIPLSGSLICLFALNLCLQTLGIIEPDE